MKQRTSPLTWFALIAVVVAGAALLASIPEPAPACPPVDREALRRAVSPETAEQFLAKAERVNSAGQCVLEGGFGTQTQKFYLAVYAPGQRGKPYHLRFTREDLKR